MVFIKRVEIKGFKSLGSRQTTIDLERGLIVITGPNGGGKSNFIEAILFGLGQNSPKMLRVSRLSSLLYDGGSPETKASKSTVSITFDNTNRSLPFDSDRVTATRELFDTGESRYSLNERRVTRNTYTDMLSVGSISPDGHNIVVQGAVTRISELLPDEKRRIIEDIAGVSHFDQKKAESMRQLHEADMRLQVALARMGEVKNRIVSLEGERNDQIRLRQLEDQIRWLKAVGASKRLEKIQRDIRDSQRLVEESSAKSEELRARLNEVRVQTASIENERDRFVSGVADEGGGRLKELQALIGRRRYELEQLQSRAEEAEGSISQAEKSLPSQISQRDDASTKLKELGTKVAESTRINEELQKVKATLEADLKKLEGTRATLEKKLSSRQRTVAHLKERISQYLDQSRSLESKIEFSKERLRLVNERRNALLFKSESFLNTLKELEGHLEELKTLKVSEHLELSKVVDLLKSTSDRRERIEEEVSRTYSVIMRASGEVVKHDSQQVVAEQLAAEELALRRLEELAEDGAVEGYLDRLTSLIEYDPQYKKAVNAAARRWLKAVVVEDTSSMIRVAELARKLKIGRLTIIPLSEVAGSKRATHPRLQGVLGILADVVEPQGVPGDVVNFVFGDTVLVATARVGYVLALQGFRCVTVSGDVFEPRGVAFETGYVLQTDAVLNVLKDNSSFDDIRKAVSTLEQVVSKRKADLARLSGQFKKLEKDHVDKAVAFERLSSEIRTTEKFLAKYVQLRKSLEVRSTRSTKLSERVQKALGRYEASLQRCKVKIQQCNERMVRANLDELARDTASCEETRRVLLGRLEDSAMQLRERMMELVRYESEVEHSLKPELGLAARQLQITESKKTENVSFLEEAGVRMRAIQEELESLLKEEARLAVPSSKTGEILDEYESRIRKMRITEESLEHQALSAERQTISHKAAFDKLRESEDRCRGELTLYGYSAPLAHFAESDDLLSFLTFEYEEVRGRVNLLADTHYMEIYLGYKDLSVRRNRLEEERNSIVQFIEGVEVEKTKVYTETLEKIDRELRKVFASLTGGSAWLEIEKPEDIFGSGLFLMTQFAGKPPRESSSVSGGEKTISTVAFIMAIQAVYPSPFYLLDEIDAHLDAVNSERLADLLREKAENSQLVVVTLKDSLVAKSKLAYGVYMANGLSQVVSFRPRLEVLARDV